MDSDSSINLQEKINEFESFLLQFKNPPKKNNEPSKQFTYTRLGHFANAGSYFIPNGIDNAKFLNDYCELYKLLEKNNSTDFVMNFSEKQNEIGPFMVDFDFNFDSKKIKFDNTKFKEDENYRKEMLKHRYTEDDIKKIVLFINETFHKYFGLQEDEIICYLQEKPMVSIKFEKNGDFKCIKDGFHLCYIYPLTMEQRERIFNHIKNYFSSKKLLDNIGFSNDYNSVFDAASLRNNWMLYGCYKALDNTTPQIYTCEYYYDYDGDKHEVDLSFDELVRVFDVRQYLNFEEPLIFNSEEFLKNYPQFIRDDNIDDILINSFKTKTINNKIIQFEPNRDFNIDDYKDLERSDVSEKERRYLYLKGLLHLVSPYRSDDYDFWTHICWALVSEGQDDENIYNLFIEFSKLSNKFNEQACKKLWDKSRSENDALEKGKRNTTIGTLISYARDDNLENYNKLINLYYHSLQEDIIANAYDTDIAQYAYNNIGYKHIYSRKLKCWFSFNGNLWDTKNDEGALYNDIIKLKQIFLNIKKNEMKYKEGELKKLEKMDESSDNESDDEDDTTSTDIDIRAKAKMEAQKVLIKQKLKLQRQIKDRKKLYNSLFKKLSTYTSLQQIIRACSMISFAVTDIDLKMDNNPYLIGFNNGIYDLDAGTFRQGKPEDYVSLSVNYDYIDYNGTEPVFVELNNYFESLFKNVEIREYVLRSLASRLEGQSNNCQINIWTGPASNGKTVFTLLINKVFGEYYGTLEANVLTTKRSNAEAPSPALMSTKGKRIVVVQEPEENEELNVGLLKQISGGQDKINGRKLHCDIVSFVPQFELFIICNNIPTLKHVDNGIARRISVVNFETVFVSGERPLKEHEARANPNIEKYIKSDKWTAPLMWLLINKWYKEYRRINLYKPKCVKYATDSYISSSDEVREFIKENYVLDKDNSMVHDTIPIKISDLHDEYITWAKNHGYIRKYRTQGKFADHITKIIGLSIKNGIIEHLYRKKIGSTDTETDTFTNNEDN